MQRSISPSCLACLALALGLSVAAGAARAEAPADLKKLHVLLVLDTNDPDVGKTLAHDERTMTALLAQGGVPESLVDLTVLKGDDATPANVLKYFSTLKLGPAEGLVFYFGGHGATDRDRGHYLAFPRLPKVLYRADLRKAMRQTGAELAVILTDCCSHCLDHPFPAEPAPAASKSVTPVGMAPGFRKLFFQTRGVVDVSGSEEGAAAWGDPDRGGVFTRALRDVLLKNKDNEAVVWKTLYPQLKAKTEETFQDLSKECAARGLTTLPAKPQTTQLFLVPGVLGIGVTADRPGTVIVSDVILDSPIDQAGFKRGEVILEIDSRPIKTVQEFNQAVDGAGGTITFKVRDRDGRAVVRTVKPAA